MSQVYEYCKSFACAKPPIFRKVEWVKREWAECNIVSIRDDDAGYLATKPAI